MSDSNSASVKWSFEAQCNGGFAKACTPTDRIERGDGDATLGRLLDLVRHAANEVEEVADGDDAGVVRVRRDDAVIDLLLPLLDLAVSVRVLSCAHTE